MSGKHRASPRPRCPRHGCWLDASHTCPCTKKLPSQNTNCGPRGNGTPRTLEEAWNRGRPSPGFATAADAIWLSPLAPLGSFPSLHRRPWALWAGTNKATLWAICPSAPASRLLNGTYARATCKPPLWGRGRTAEQVLCDVPACPRGLWCQVTPSGAPFC